MFKKRDTPLKQQGKQMHPGREVTTRAAARRYEISLQVLKNIARMSEVFSTQEEKFRISKRPCNVLFII